MEARAIARHVRVAPRKARFIADHIRGKSVTEAYDVLGLVKRHAALPINKLIASAVANAMNNAEGKHLDADHLKIKSIYIDGGPTLKRFRPCPMGRAARIRKRTCHITVIVEESES